jgi:hypothetical protein
VLMQEHIRWWRWSIEQLSDCHMVYPSLFTDAGGYCIKCGHKAPDDDA